MRKLLKQYFRGYFPANDRELDVVAKQSNRTVLAALREAYPSGLNAQELSEATRLPLKTIYASLKELIRELYLIEVGKPLRIPGRPPTRELLDRVKERSAKFVIEDVSRIYDIQATFPEGNYALAPGNSDYSDEFISAWHKLIPKEEVQEINNYLFKFVEKKLRMISESDNDEIRNWAPTDKPDYCCTQCGINHEARDFVRALLVHLVDHFEKDSKFIDFMKNIHLVDSKVYDDMRGNIGKPKCYLE